MAKLRAEKGLDLLLEAFARMRSSPEVRLLIVGDGEERSSLESLAAKLGVSDRVVFHGSMPDPRDAYRAMDVFALSSRTEQMPISVVEAMSCACPVVATAVGDVPTMVAKENERWIVSDRNVEAFSGALDDAFRADPERVAAGSCNCDKAGREFRRQDMLTQYQTLYDAVIDQR